MLAVMLVGDQGAMQTLKRAIGRVVKSDITVDFAETIPEAEERLSAQAVNWLICDLDAVGVNEGTAFMRRMMASRPKTDGLALLTKQALTVHAAQLEGVPYALKPISEARIQAMASTIYQRSTRRREFGNGNDRGESMNDKIIPIQLHVRKWLIPLSERERQLLEYGLYNASDELVRNAKIGMTIRGTNSLLLLIRVSHDETVDPGYLERRCRLMRRVARSRFYAELAVSIGEPVDVYELPVEPADASGDWVDDDSISLDRKLDYELRLRRAHQAEHAAIRQIFAYVNDHLMEEVTRESIAQHVHFHPAYLSRFFKKQTGLSLSAYILAKRIEQAKKLLAQPELKIGHIVHRLGYYNCSHFSRTFKKVTGFTPKQYRKRLSQ